MTNHGIDNRKIRQRFIRPGFFLTDFISSSSASSRWKLPSQNCR
jgi:hypothetical protein